MINYLKSEHYRLMRQKATFLIPALLLGFVYSALGLTYFSGRGNPDFPYNNTAFIYLSTRFSFAIPLAALPFLVNYLFGSEFENGTFKNSVSYGIHRWQLFLGKLVVILIATALLIPIVFIPYIIGVEWLMENSGLNYLIEFLTFSSYMSLILAGALFLAIALRFLLQHTGAYLGVYFLLMFGVANVFGVLANLFPAFELPFRLFPLYHILTPVVHGWDYAIAIFLIYGTLSVLIGLRSFTRSDL